MQKTNWLEKNGFNENKITYIYFPNDSYQMRESLKDAGFQFSKELLWHSAIIPTGYEDKVIEVSLDTIGEMMAWGDGMFNAGVKNQVKELLIAARPEEPESNSEWVGEIGERLYNISAIMIEARSIQTKYGLTNLVKFEDELGNIYTWWTTSSSFEKFEIGDKLSLNGTVKKWDEYNGIKSTILNRCKLMEV